jgi:hypothetical protein
LQFMSSGVYIQVLTQDVLCELCRSLVDCEVLKAYLLNVTQECRLRTRDLLGQPTLGSGLTSLAPSIGSVGQPGVDATAAAIAAQNQQQLLQLASSPYGDSPLFRNLRLVSLSSRYFIRTSYDGGIRFSMESLVNIELCEVLLIYAAS